MVVYRKNYQCGINISPQKYKHISVVGNYRPFNSLAPYANKSSDSVKINEFRSRPIKHWRKQYATTKLSKSYINK